LEGWLEAANNTTNNTNFDPGKNGNLSGGNYINFPEDFLQNDSGAKMSYFIPKKKCLKLSKKVTLIWWEGPSHQIRVTSISVPSMHNKLKLLSSLQDHLSASKFQVQTTLKQQQGLQPILDIPHRTSGKISRISSRHWFLFCKLLSDCCKICVPSVNFL
jgi:hypothetical protein